MKRTTLFNTINLLLVLTALILLNLVGTGAYRRFDLTGNDAYSLSRVSRETLARVEDPLRIKVYYSPEVPAPYNGVRQYLLDMLREFETAGPDLFSYEIIDPTSEEGRREAQSLGLQQVEIQEVRSDEFASRAVFMGAVVQYGNVVERIDGITTTAGLEYRLTTAMRSAITQVDALAGTTGTVTMQVFASPGLAELGIEGFRELETQMVAIHERVNADNYGRLSFEFVQPGTEDAVSRIVEEFGVEPLQWDDGSGIRRRGLLEIVLRHEEAVQRIPLEIYTGLFGGYSLADPAEIEESVRQGLRSLVAANPRVAYSVTAGEKLPGDFQQGAGPFAEILGESYEVVNVDLSEEGVPAGVETLILNGPTEAYSEDALYRIDQFVMDGGSLLVFLDRHLQIIPTQQEMMAGAQPTWEFNPTNLTELLEHYGLEVTDQIVLDEESFIARQRSGTQQLFQAPVIGGTGLNRDNPVTAGLEDVIVLNATEVLPTRGSGSDDGAPRADGDAAYIPLLQTSRRSWLVENPSEVGPWITGAPVSGDTAPRDVAVLLQGRLESYFPAPVALDGVERFRRAGIEPADILVVSASALTTGQMIDPSARTPNGTFLLNAVDYLNGAPGMAELRSKGLGVARLGEVSPTLRRVTRWSNTILVPVLVLAVGAVVWMRRRRRSRRIHAIFALPTEEKK
jgi:ABC-2 type transport system permease protein